MRNRPERGPEIDRENLVEHGVGIILDRGKRATDPGVEEQAVDRAVVRDGRIERGDQLRPIPVNPPVTTTWRPENPSRQAEYPRGVVLHDPRHHFVAEAH